FVQARDRRSPPRKQLAYRDPFDSFEGVMIPRREHGRDVYRPRDLAPDDDRYRRKRSRSQSSRSSRRHHHRKYDDSDSDTDSDISSDEERERSKVRNRTLVAACLATVTTVAAGNNVYQATKAHEARKKEMEEGGLSKHEAQEMKKKGMKLDLLSLGIAGVCLYNAKNGWKRLEAQKEEARKARERYKEERKVCD
ncbi:MAG: hypothetical protein Q9219_000158, partial [cf. Caloplaca sp. 3 TL-2023]